MVSQVLINKIFFLSASFTEIETDCYIYLNKTSFFSKTNDRTQRRAKAVLL